MNESTIFRNYVTLFDFKVFKLMDSKSDNHENRKR